MFDLYKNEGILKTNLEEIGKENPEFEKISSSTNKLNQLYVVDVTNSFINLV